MNNKVDDSSKDEKQDDYKAINKVVDDDDLSKEEKQDDYKAINKEEKQYSYPKRKDISKVELIDKGTYYQIPTDLDINSENVISVLCISDTHALHKKINEKDLPKATILIHAGDFTNVGLYGDIKSYDNWVKDLKEKNKKYEHSILIAGNHDITLHESYYNGVGKYIFHGEYDDKQLHTPKECREAIKNNIYLEDQATKIEGLNIYGSPWQPEFCNWAFNLPTYGDSLKNVWKKVPNNVDILVTHGPPYLHGDKIIDQNNESDDEFEDEGENEYENNRHVGDKELLKKVTELQPKFHIFGHIHEGYGVTKMKGCKTIFINASSVSVHYIVCQKPILFYIEKN